jgi:hypothetical protein
MEQRYIPLRLLQKEIRSLGCEARRNLNRFVQNVSCIRNPRKIIHSPNYIFLSCLTEYLTRISSTRYSESQRILLANLRRVSQFNSISLDPVLPLPARNRNSVLDPIAPIARHACHLF